MIRSMTGFGTAEGVVGGARVSVDLRTVNHRFFTSSIKLPQELSRWEQEVREALKRRISRGHVTLGARMDRGDDGRTPDVVIDESRFAAYVSRLRELHDRHGLTGGVDLASVLRMPDVLTVNGREDTGSADEMLAIVEQALEALSVSRTDEGGRLAVFLEERLAVIESALARISDRAPERLVAQRDRLRRNVQQLADGIAIDEQRVAQEIAILADRLDVQEELSRFASHITAFRESIRQQSGEPVGKRLGFLVQEMLREANTTGSKANDSAILQDVVLIKEELERVREQVENLE